MSEEKYGITVVFFDKPNMDFVEEALGGKINHDKFFAFLAENEKEKELHVRFYWQNNDSIYGKHLKQLRVKLQAQGIRFISVETEKDVDITMMNDMFTMLFDVNNNSLRPEKIILCSGDKAFSIILGAAKRRLGISITIISGVNQCAEVLKQIFKDTIFIEDMINNNKNLILDSLNSNSISIE